MGWGSSTRRGGGLKVRSLPRKFVFLGFGGREAGTSREFCRDVPDLAGVRKVCANNKIVRIFRSLTGFTSAAPRRVSTSSGKKKSLNSVQTRCIVKGEAQKSPLFWRFLGALIFSGSPAL